jgi:amino acid transporter
MPASAATEPVAHLRRALGVWDLAWLCVVAIANLNVVPVIAASGPTTVWLWLAALVFFFLPQGITVIELSSRMPAEGGIYVWAKDSFGDLHGFLCGWCYWTANIFYIPTLLFYLVGIVTYTGGPAVAGMADNPYVFFTITVGMLWVATLANIRGLGVGKWVNNAGGFGTLIAAGLLIVLAAFTVWRHGFSLPASSFAVKNVDWKVISSFGVICFGLVGLELGPVMGDEIRDPRRSVPRGILIGGILSGGLYLFATLALLLAVPQQNLKVLQGVLQGVDSMSSGLGSGWLVKPIAALMFVSIVGCASAWISGSARVLFVSGLDRYLPALFGKVHPKYGTPHYALMGMAVLSSGLIGMSFGGKTSIKEAYVTLLDLSVVLQMMSYLYLYGALTVAAFGKVWKPGVYRRTTLRVAAISGLVTTSIGMVVAFVPSRQVESVWRFEFKMVATCVVFLSLAAGLFAYYSRRAAKV